MSSKKTEIANTVPQSDDMNQMTPIGSSFTLIHFVFQTNPERVACMPNMTEFHSTNYHPHVLRTGEARATTCPACKKTDQYKRTMERQGGK